MNRASAEMALWSSEERFRALARHAPVGIFLSEQNGDCVFVNPRWCELAGMSEGEAKGKGWLRALHPEDRERVLADWERAVREKNSSAAEYRFLRPDGSVVWLEGSAAELHDGLGALAGYVGTVADITPRKRAEEILRAEEARLRAHAEELEKNVLDRTASLREAVTQMEEFSYSVSHDLRSPLRAINGYAQVLLDDYAQRLDDTARAYLDRIQRSAQRMENLTSDLLIYSRLGRLDMRSEAIGLEALLKDVIHQYVELQPAQADLRIDQPLHDVFGHESALHQSIANLLTNSAKFVPAGVRPSIRVWTEKRGERVRLWIEDNGIGIKPEHQNKLFQVFERVPTLQSFEGTGIGLAIVRRAMDRMGGTCGVVSDGSRGSQFWVELPGALS